MRAKISLSALCHHTHKSNSLSFFSVQFLFNGSLSPNFIVKYNILASNKMLYFFSFLSFSFNFLVTVDNKKLNRYRLFPNSDKHFQKHCRHFITIFREFYFLVLRMRKFIDGYIVTILFLRYDFSYSLPLSLSAFMSFRLTRVSFSPFCTRHLCLSFVRLKEQMIFTRFDLVLNTFQPFSDLCSTPIGDSVFFSVSSNFIFAPVSGTSLLVYGQCHKINCEL